jgi:hypothetical protein
MYAPDILGFHRERPALCAIDMEARPPVIRQLWTFATILPSKDEGYSAEEDYLCLRLVGLAYLLEEAGSASHCGELLLRKRRSPCYRLPPDNQMATVLPAL